MGSGKINKEEEDFYIFLEKEKPYNEEEKNAVFSAVPLIDPMLYEGCGIPVLDENIEKNSILDLDIDKLSSKPWEQGEDITDYFNYGFNEKTWKEYLANQIHI